MGFLLFLMKRLFAAVETDCERDQKIVTNFCFYSRTQLSSTRLELAPPLCFQGVNTVLSCTCIIVHLNYCTFALYLGCILLVFLIIVYVF